MTHDGIGKYLTQIVKKAPGPTADIVEISKGNENRCRGQLFAGWFRDGNKMVRGAGPRSGLWHVSMPFRFLLPARNIGADRFQDHKVFPLLEMTLRARSVRPFCIAFLTSLFVDRGVRAGPNLSA